MARHFRTTKFPLRAPDGSINGVAGLSIDMTDMVMADAAVAESRAEREAAVAGLEAREVRQ